MTADDTTTAVPDDDAASDDTASVIEFTTADGAVSSICGIVSAAPVEASDD